MIRMIGFYRGEFVSDVMPNTPANRLAIEFALQNGFVGAVIGMKA